ncbi:hypothetical protein P3W45_001642 [Vairimorpha bombi]
MKRLQKSIRYITENIENSFWYDDYKAIYSLMSEDKLNGTKLKLQFVKNDWALQSVKRATAVILRKLDEINEGTAHDILIMKKKDMERREEDGTVNDSPVANSLKRNLNKTTYMKVRDLYNRRSKKDVRNKNRLILSEKKRRRCFNKQTEVLYVKLCRSVKMCVHRVLRKKNYPCHRVYLANAKREYIKRIYRLISKESVVSISILKAENKEIKTIYEEIKGILEPQDLRKIRKIKYKKMTHVRIWCRSNKYNDIKKWCGLNKYEILKSSNKRSVSEKNELKKKKDEEIRFMTLNINRIMNKTMELNLLLNKEFPTVLCIQETWKNDKSNFRIPRYNCHEFNNGSELNRGLITLVKKSSSIRSYIVNRGEFNLCSCIEIQQEDYKWKKMLIINNYIPHKNKEMKRALSETIDVILEAKNRKIYDEIVVMGDFNLVPEALARKLQAKGLSVDLRYNKVKGTRIGPDERVTSRRIDYIFRIIEQDNVKMKICLKWFLSDHLIVSRKMNIRSRKSVSQDMFFRSDMSSTSKGEKLCNKIRKDDVTSYYQVVPLLNRLCKETKVIRARSVEKKRWYSKKIKKMFERYYKEKKRASCNGISNIEKARMGLVRNKLKKLKEIEKKKMTQKWAMKGIKLLTCNNARDAWRWLMAKSRKDTDLPLKGLHGGLVTDPLEKLEMIKEHYRILSSWKYDLDPYIPFSTGCILIEEISRGELKFGIKSCANFKACGPDGLPSELWKLLDKEDENEPIEY